MNEAALLDLWERSAGKSPVERSLVLASHAGPVESGTPLGHIAANVLDLRTRLFGPRFELMSACPACGEPTEVEFLANQLPMSSSTEEVVSVETGEYRLLARPANSLDVAFILRFDDADDAEAALRRRCVLKAERNGSLVDPDDLPDSVWMAVEAALDALDPLATAGVNLECEKCGETWRAHLDIAAIAFRELTVDSKGILAQVDALARAYGWTEDNVLTLSPARRRSYLDMVKT